MRAVVQRVSSASVAVEGDTVGAIDRGLLVLLGVEVGDANSDVEYLVNKTAGLRIFDDADGNMNLALAESSQTTQASRVESSQETPRGIAGADKDAAILVISQFTLLGDVRKGKRPSFISAARPEEANRLYQAYCVGLRARGLRVEQGVFQADMQVSLVNDGPVTILLDSKKLF